MIRIEEISVERINEYWNIQYQYLVDDGMITIDEEKEYFQSSEYQGKKWSLSALASMLTQSKWGVAGSRYFKYNGEWLNGIRKRLGV